MSKGNPIVPIRIPKDLLDKLDEAMFFSGERRREGEWTRSSWIIQAIKDKLAHRARSNNKDRRRLARVKAKAKKLLDNMGTA